MGIEDNGFLDINQTIVNYAVRELQCSFADVIDQDPSFQLSRWERLRRNAQMTSTGVAIAGAGSIFLGSITGATLLIGAGVAVTALSGWLIRHHSEGVKAIQLEAGILDQCRPILRLLAQLESSGANSSDLVSLYDRVIRAASVGRLDADDPAQLEAFFRKDLEQSNVVNRLAGNQDPVGIAATSAIPTNVTRSIGASTRLNAVDAIAVESGKDGEWWQDDPSLQVAAVPMARAAHPNNAFAEPWGEDELMPAAKPESRSPVDYLIGSRLRTALLVAVSGGGKDIILSNALRQFLATHSGFKVIVMDCKDDSKETGYYDVKNVRVHRLNVTVSSDGEVVEWVDRCLQEFINIPGKALLICNEGTLIREKSKRYVDVVAGLVSSGDSREMYVWEAGQSAHTDDLKINGAARSRFRLMIVGMKGEEMQVEAVMGAKCVADSARNMEDVRTQLLRSPVGRAWCDGQRWFPMPELENHSGYNRDKRSHVKGAAPETMNSSDVWASVNATMYGEAL